MAFWAKLLFFIGVASLVISVIGLMFLLRSLHHTKTAIRDNKDIGKIANKPYLTVNHVKYDASFQDDAKCPLAYFISFENLGQSPSYNIKISAHVEFQDERKTVSCVKIDKNTGYFGGGAGGDVTIDFGDAYRFLSKPMTEGKDWYNPHNLHIVFEFEDEFTRLSSFNETRQIEFVFTNVDADGHGLVQVRSSG